MQLLGTAPGQKTDKLVRPVRLVPSPTEPLAEVGGINVHAKTVVDGRDRKRLERLCRTIARPALSRAPPRTRTKGQLELDLSA